MSVEKIGVAGAPGEENHLPLPQVPVSRRLGMDLPHRAHGNGGENPGGLPQLLQHVLEGQAVDDGGQHAHLVGPGPLHPAAPVLDPPPEVAAAHHQAHLDPVADTVLHHLAYLPGKGEINAPARRAGQSLAADLQQNALIRWFLHRYLPCPPQGERVCFLTAPARGTERHSVVAILL